MEFGFSMRGQYPVGTDMQQSFAKACELARTADRLGYSYLSKGQHYSSTPLQALQQVPFLSRIMAEAPNIKLVTGVVLLPLHKPLDIAEQLATLDVMSGGRLVFGSGIGYRDVEFKAFGTVSKDRGRRFEENLTAIRRLWTEPSVTMKGTHFELDEASCSVMPVQKPTPPFWVGANVDAGVRRAARMADAWMINPHQHVDTIERQLGVYREALAAHGKPEPAALPMMRECFVAETDEKAFRLARPYLEAKYKSYHEWGQDKSMAKGDDNLDLPFEELAEGRFLLGSPERVAEQILGYRERLGVSVIIPSFQSVGTPHEQVLDALHLFAESVMPKVRAAI
ncbi:MAG: LLM class flavin-dependent oxidoreductase [Gammaproteobacteria bacterium]|nr:LLM class flavin-dependent oxidoreductase [Gammaproteobacteria bacterium]